MSVVASNTAHVAAVLGFAFIMVLMNLLATSSCQQLMKTIGDEKKELDKLRDAQERESTRWQEMCTPAKIEAALLRHGLMMRPPRSDQNVYMNADGKPYPGQISLAKATQRKDGTGRTAQYKAVRSRVKR